MHSNNTISDSEQQMLKILFILVYLSGIGRADETAVFLPQSNEATTVTEPTTLLICEGAVANLTCPPRRQIRVRLANFGRFTFKDCNPTLSITFDQQCKNDQTVPALRQRCDDRRECLVPVNVETFSADGEDPCPGTTKYLDVIYDCVDAPTTTTSTTTATTTTPTASTILPETTADVLRPIGVGEDTVVDHGDYRTHSRSKNGDVNREKDIRPSSQFCQPTMVRHVQWPRMAIGHLARVMCPTFSTATSTQLLNGMDGAFGASEQRVRLSDDVERVAEWMCDADGRWSPPDAPDLRRCAASWTQKARADLDDEDAAVLETVVYMEETLRDLDTSLRATDTLFGGDLINIIHMLQRLAVAHAQRAGGFGAVRTTDITKLFIDIVGQLLANRHRAAWTDIGGRTERARLADALIGDDGLVAHALAPLISTLSAGGGAKQLHAAASTLSVEVLLVPSRSYDFFVVPTATFADSSDERVTLPKASLRALDGSEAGLTGIIFASYPPNVGHYLMPSITSGRPSDSSAETSENESVERNGFAMVSKVVSIWIRGQTTSKATNTVLGVGSDAVRENVPITLFFRMRPDDAMLLESDFRCVWWRRETMTWRYRGCHMTERNATHAVCECADPRTHSGNDNGAAMMRFAVVRVPKSTPFDGGSVGPNVVHLLTSILFNYGLVASCVVALLCLGLALFSLYAIGASTCCERVTIHRHLCASLCAAEALLLAGALRTTLSSAACEQWLDPAFRMFTLAAFAWTLIDAFYLHRYGYAASRPFIADPTVLVQSKQHVHNVGRRVAMFSLFGYGLPLFIVGAFVFVKRSRQGRGITADSHDEFCWLSVALSGGADVAFLAPGALFLAAASLFLALLLRDICRKSSDGADASRTARNFYIGGCDAAPSSRQPQVVANPFEKLYSASSATSSAASPTPSPDGCVTDDALHRAAMKSTAAVVLSLAACFTFAALWAASKRSASGNSSSSSSSILWATVFCVTNIVLAAVTLVGHVLWDEKMQFDYDKWLAQRDWLPTAWIMRIYRRISNAGGGSLSGSSSASASPNGHSTAAFMGAGSSGSGGGSTHNQTFYFAQQAPQLSSSGFDRNTNTTTASTTTATTGLGSTTNCCGNGTSTSSDVSDCLLACNGVGALRTLIIPNGGGAAEPHYNGSASCCSAASLSALRKTSLTAAAVPTGSASCCMPRRAKVAVGGGCCKGGGDSSAATASAHHTHPQQHHYGMSGAPSTQQLLLPGQQPEVCACYALGAENGAYDYATIPYGDFNSDAADISHHPSVNGIGNASMARRPSPHPSLVSAVGGRQQPLRVETPQVPSTCHAAADEYRGSCPPPVFPPPPPPPPPPPSSEPCCGGCGHHQVSPPTYRQSMLGVDDSLQANLARQCGTPTVYHHHQPPYYGGQHFASNNSCVHLQQAQQNSPSPLRGSCRLITQRSSQAFGSQTHLVHQMQNQQQPYYGCQQRQQQVCLRRDVTGAAAYSGSGNGPSASNLVLRMDFSRNEPLFTEEIPQRLLVDDDDAVD